MFSSRWYKLSTLFTFTLLIAGLVSPKLLSATVGFQPVNPDELKMTGDPAAPGVPAMILFREVNRDDFGNSHGGIQVSSYNSIARFEEDYYRIKVLTEEGRKYADIEIPLLKGYRDITGIRARTIKPDGSIAEFNGTIYQKTVYKRKGLSYQAKTFTLPDVQVGSVIEYYYTIHFDGGRIWFSHWVVSDNLFQRSAKFSLHPWGAEWAHVSLRWSQHLPPGMPEPKQDKDYVVRLEVRNVPAFQTEDFMPPEDQYRATVDFIYTPDSFDPDVNKFWKKYGKKKYDEVEGFAGKRGGLDQIVAQTIAANDSPEVKLQKLYAKVQQMRNTSYEEKKTEEEKKRDNEKDKDSANALEILKRGFGSEEQLNWLYLALVRTAGFESYPLAVSNRSENFFNPQLMNTHNLDQTAVLVRVNGKDAYLSPGAEFTPYGLLKWEETAVQALKLDKDGGSWIQTSVPDSTLSKVERKADFKVNDNGDLEGKVFITFTGLEGLRRRVEKRNDDAVARKKYLEEEVQHCVPAASEVTLANEPDWNNSARPLQAEFSVKVPGWVTRGGKLAFLPMGLFAASEKHLFDYTSRTYPIYFEFPAQKVDDITITLPEGWKISGIPQAQNADYHVVAYSAGVEDKKGALHLTRKLDINIISLEPKYYSPLRSFFQGVKTGDDQKIILEPGTAISSK